MSSAYDVKATLSIYMQIEDTISFDSTLFKTQIHLNLLIDPAGQNIFHDIANCMIKEELLLSFLNIFLAHLKSRYPLDFSTIIKEMLNTQSIQDRRTPLLSAIHHNRFSLIKEFIRLGADCRIKDINQRGPLHIAASLGRINIFVYLHSLGLSLEDEDSSLRTALHHSAIEAEESMSLLIIAWAKSTINKQDENGQTPLHLACFSKSYKITRHLLINGAHKKITDKEGKTALEYAVEAENKELIKILKPLRVINKINPCKAPIKPVKNSFELFILYIVILLARYCAVLLFLLPRMSGFFAFVSLALFATSSVSFIIASKKDPGFVDKKKDPLDLYAKYKPDYICPYCVCKKIKTTRHCQHCKRCVRKFDHHCPWIRNCVGEANRKVFFVFLTVFTVDLLFHAILGIFDYLSIYEAQHEILPHVPTNHDEAALSVSCCCALTLMFVSPIWYVQLGNILKGTTTYERFGYGVSGKDSKISDSQSMLLGNENEWSAGKTQDFSVLNSNGCCGSSAQRKYRVNLSQ